MKTNTITWLMVNVCIKTEKTSVRKRLAKNDLYPARTLNYICSRNSGQ